MNAKAIILLPIQQMQKTDPDAATSVARSTMPLEDAARLTADCTIYAKASMLPAAVQETNPTNPP